MLVFFITYVLFQPPATILCRKIGARRFLGGICLLWGIVMVRIRTISHHDRHSCPHTRLTAGQLSHGLINKWTDMIPLRLLLGLFEAGFFPGCLYLISTWYTRYELHQRYSLFYLVGCVVTGFGGILAYGLMQMVRTDKTRHSLAWALYVII